MSSKLAPKRVHLSKRSEETKVHLPKRNEDGYVPPAESEHDVLLHAQDKQWTFINYASLYWMAVAVLAWYESLLKSLKDAEESGGKMQPRAFDTIITQALCEFRVPGCQVRRPDGKTSKLTTGFFLVDAAKSVVDLVRSRLGEDGKVKPGCEFLDATVLREQRFHRHSPPDSTSPLGRAGNSHLNLTGKYSFSDAVLGFYGHFRCVIRSMFPREVRQHERAFENATYTPQGTSETVPIEDREFVETMLGLYQAITKQGTLVGPVLLEFSTCRDTIAQALKDKLHEATSAAHLQKGTRDRQYRLAQTVPVVNTTSSEKKQAPRFAALEVEGENEEIVQDETVSDAPAADDDRVAPTRDATAEDEDGFVDVRKQRKPRQQRPQHSSPRLPRAQRPEQTSDQTTESRTKTAPPAYTAGTPGSNAVAWPAPN